MHKKMNGYILITPAKNEEENLPGLIETIRNQKLKPRIWIIVDDGSSDNTRKIIENAKSVESWIHGLFLPLKENYDIEEHYADVCRKGFDYAFQIAERFSVTFDYIGLSDADMIYPENYFFDLIDYLEIHTDYGLISGSIKIKDKNGTFYQERSPISGNDMALGTGRVWRKNTFDETGGYPNVRAPDTVSNILAINRGWKTARISNIICYQTRDTGSKFRIWKGYVKRGQRAYYLNTNILSFGNTIFDLIFISHQKNMFKKSIALIYGYFISFVNRDNQISIREVKNYNANYKRVIKTYLRFIKKNFSIGISNTIRKISRR